MAATCNYHLPVSQSFVVILSAKIRLMSTWPKEIANMLHLSYCSVHHADTPGVLSVLRHPSLPKQCTSLYIVPEVTFAYMEDVASLTQLTSLEFNPCGPAELLLHQTAFWTGLTNLGLQCIEVMLPEELTSLPHLNTLSVVISEDSRVQPQFEDLTNLTEIYVGLENGPAMLPPLRALLPRGSNVQCEN